MLMKLITFFTALFTVVGASEIRRKLSYERIAGYEPTTSVTDHNAIDRDQMAIETQVDLKTLDSFAIAKKIYTMGGNSKSYATLNVIGGLSVTAGTDEDIVGESASGQTVYGIILEDAMVDSTTLKFQYKTSQQQATYLDCQVGGLPEPNFNGCLAPNATLRLDGSASAIAYSYDPETDNQNARYIQFFSTTANERMRKNGDGDFYEDIQKFIDYYGDETYADMFITGALDGTKVTFSSTEFDFSQHDLEARAEAVAKGCAYMSIFMYVIRELEDGLDDCENGCATGECEDDLVSSLDEGVAFYTGSYEGTDGTGEGFLMYALADKRCSNFRTCGRDGKDLTGTSKVNSDVFSLFNKMKTELQQKDCAAARLTKVALVQKMIVPLIQGTLRYAYRNDFVPDVTQKDESEGATFAAAVLPWINACSAADAQTIYNNMQIGAQENANFADVKKAFENTYGCLKITCADVGGLWDDGNNKYFEGAEPCGNAGYSAAANNYSIQFSLTAVVVAIAMIFTMN